MAGVDMVLHRRPRIVSTVDPAERTHELEQLVSSDIARSGVGKLVGGFGHAHGSGHVREIVQRLGFGFKLRVACGKLPVLDLRLVQFGEDTGHGLRREQRRGKRHFEGVDGEVAAGLANRWQHLMRHPTFELAGLGLAAA